MRTLLFFFLSSVRSFAPSAFAEYFGAMPSDDTCNIPRNRRRRYHSSRKKNRMNHSNHRSSSIHHRRMNELPRKKHSHDRPRLPIYRNLRDSPNNMNQESIFAHLAKKHKKKPDVPVVSIDDDDHAEMAGQVVEMDVVTSDEDILILTDLEEGEIIETEETPSGSGFIENSGEANSEALTDIEVTCSERSSRSSSDPEVIELSDSDDDTAEVSVIKEVVTPPRKARLTKLTPKKRRSDCKPCEPSFETALSVATHAKFRIHPRLWRVTQTLPVTSKSAKIRICSYNVLCQLTIGSTQHLYKHTRSYPDVLLWENRWENFQKELYEIGADVFCLQEVQYDHYTAYFNPFLNSLGYSGLYKRKTGSCVDGCAIFYKKNVFKSVRYRIVEYFVDKQCVMDKHQIAQILRLKCIKNDQELVIANTHIIFNNQRGDIKLGQLALLFANIDDEMKNGNAPLIIMGDFNMEPQSFVYNFITDSSVFLKGIPRNELSGQGKKGGPVVDAKKIIPSQCKVLRDCTFVDKIQKIIPDDVLTHPFHLASVYNHLNNNNSKDVSTSHVEDANPDFIFYTVLRKERFELGCHIFEDTKLCLLRYLTLPDSDVIKSTLGPWPNKDVPSDHIPLIADFMLSSA